jgi:hypothetical protein
MGCEAKRSCPGSQGGSVQGRDSRFCRPTTAQGQRSWSVFRQGVGTDSCEVLGGVISSYGTDCIYTQGRGDRQFATEAPRGGM